MSLEDMLKKLKNKDRFTRGIAISTLVKWNVKSDIEPNILAALKKEKNLSNKQGLLDILRKINTNLGINTIIEHLKDKDYHITDHAIKLIKNIRSTEVINAISNVLQTHKHEYSRREASTALVELTFEQNKDQNIRVLFDAMKKEKKEYARKEIRDNLFKIFSKLKNETYLEFLEYIIKNEDEKYIVEKAQNLLGSAKNEVIVGGKVFTPSFKDKFLELENLDLEDFRGAQWENAIDVIENLRIWDCKVKSLNGIETLKNLKSFVVPSNIELEDIRNLGQCKNLEKISIGRNKIISLEYIKNLSKLKVLSISINKLGKIEDLSGLSNLEVLTLKEVGIREITGLNTLKNLKHLNLSSNYHITEIKGIDNLVNLKKLELRGNQITEITGLDRLVNLEEVNLKYNKITEISGLENLVRLKKLDLSNNEISEVTGSPNLFYLEEIDLSSNPLPEDIIKQSPKELFKGLGVASTIGGIHGGEIDVYPFEHGILSKNRETFCLYCKSSVPPDQNQQSRCRSDLKKIITAASDRIPYFVEGSRDVVDKVIEKPYFKYDRATGRSESGIRKIIKYKKELKETTHLGMKLFYSLAGTVCDNCANQFFEENKPHFEKVRVGKEAYLASTSIDAAIKHHGEIVTEWIEKAIELNT